MYVGTSGWQYRSWRGRLYPTAVPQRSWLPYFASRFATVEVNNTFYRLPDRSTFELWARETPDDFVFAVKMSRFLTHVRRLRDPEEPVARFLEHAEPLGTKLGPVLLQLPPSMRAAPDRLAHTLDLFPRDVRVAIEFRHDSWYTDEVRALLCERNVALCLADRASRPVTPLWRTAGWGYVRLHAGRGRPRPCYGRSAVRHWSERLEERWELDSDLYVYFNNDPEGCAVRDARRFARSAARRGFPVTRTPAAREAPVG